ncbi:MAG: hypothetical protein SWK76_06480 [Actinomycetota bacterium]|nr:hypothetical protein [Actinomycetota bacterium]
MECKAGAKLSGKVDHAFYPTLFAADVCGAFESFEGVRAKLGYGCIGDELFIDVKTWEEAPEERLRVDEGAMVSAQADFKGCGVCGLSLEVSNLRWEPDTGKLFDRRTGERLFVQGIGAIAAVLRQLESELGDEIPHLISDLTYGFYRRLKKEHPQAFEDLHYIYMREFGVPDNPKPTPAELEASLDIRNGFNGPILAGLVAAICGGENLTWSWDYPAEGIVRVRSG